MSVFLDYIEKSANRECPGGLYGCTDKSDDNTPCQDRISYFLEKNALYNRTIITKHISPIILFFIFFIFSFTQIQNICSLSLIFSV
jgi:hypothetical protein